MADFNGPECRFSLFALTAKVGVGTGVDITDSNNSADMDRMLTQLFLTTIPISAEYSKPHLAKLNDALLMFKQIFGRLVRRPGRSNLHIHVLDARANVKTGPYRRFKAFTDKYKTIKDL